MSDPYATRTGQERDFLTQLEALALASHQTRVEQFSNFTAWAPRQNLARFLCAAEIYKRIIGVHGVVIEGGVAGGAGLFTWAHLASIWEPFNYTRKVIGFEWQPADELRKLAAIHDMNRPIGHIPQVELIAGDAAQTIPAIAKRPGLIVALLVLDFTKELPTQKALECMVPLIPAGGVVVAGGIWPEEMALLDPQMRWERCPWSPTLVWAVKS